MQSRELKIIIFGGFIAILGALAYLGYNSYLSQRAQIPKFPYMTTVTPEPTPTTLPGEVISESDKTGTIEKELDATNLPDIESDLKGLEEESAGL